MLGAACLGHDTPPQVLANAHESKAVAAALEETSAADQTAPVGLGSDVHSMDVHGLARAQGSSEVQRVLHSGGC